MTYFLASFHVGIHTLLQFAGIFKSFRILFTTAGFFDSSNQYSIATSSNWMDMTDPSSSLLIFSLFISLNVLVCFLYCSAYLIGHAFLHLEPAN